MRTTGAASAGVNVRPTRSDLYVVSPRNYFAAIGFHHCLVPANHRLVPTNHRMLPANDGLARANDVPRWSANDKICLLPQKVDFAARRNKTKQTCSAPEAMQTPQAAKPSGLYLITK